MNLDARFSEFAARRPRVIDGGIVAALLLFDVVTNRGVGGDRFLVDVALALPLLWRRHHARAVFAVMVLVALTQWLLDVRASGDLALLVGLYSVAVAESTRTTLVATGVLEVGIAMVAVRWTPNSVAPAFIGLSGMAVAAAVLGMSVRGRRQLVDSLHERAARLEYERDQQGQLAAAAERARIARDMHDIVAHHLSVMIALVDGATYQVRDAPERAETAMATASRTGRQALGEMRRLLGVLRDEEGPALSPQPGIAEIEALVGRLHTAGVDVRYERSGPDEPLEPGLELTAYRIVQEALTNALKHAGDGARASVTLARTGDDVVVEIRDTGVGATTAPGAEGGGLRGMRERAAVYGGEVAAGPHPDGGWCVRTRLSASAEPQSVPA
jgi:signal transduction histidine kinase